jgi:hypothetical protein
MGGFPSFVENNAPTVWIGKGGAFAYTLYFSKPVDRVRIKGAGVGPSVETFLDDQYKAALEGRNPGGTYIAKIFKRGQLTDIALSPDQMDRFNRRKSTPVFLPARDAYWNSINGFKIDEPIEGLGLTRFRLERFDSKRATTPNEMLYIAAHNTYYGLVAPVDYFVFNQSRNEEYIYLRVFDNTSGRARKIAIKVAALRKIVAY